MSALNPFFADRINEWMCELASPFQRYRSLESSDDLSNPSSSFLHFRSQSPKRPSSSSESSLGAPSVATVTQAAGGGGPGGRAGSSGNIWSVSSGDPALLEVGPTVTQTGENLRYQQLRKPPQQPQPFQSMPKGPTPMGEIPMPHTHAPQPPIGKMPPMPMPPPSMLNPPMNFFIVPVLVPLPCMPQPPPNMPSLPLPAVPGPVELGAVGPRPVEMPDVPHLGSFTFPPQPQPQQQQQQPQPYLTEGCQCGHSNWKLLRTRKGLNHFLCRKCNRKWRSPVSKSEGFKTRRQTTL